MGIEHGWSRKTRDMEMGQKERSQPKNDQLCGSIGTTKGGRSMDLSENGASPISQDYRFIISLWRYPIDPIGTNARDEFHGDGNSIETTPVLGMVWHWGTIKAFPSHLESYSATFFNKSFIRWPNIL